jgi:hypothetical protein
MAKSKSKKIYDKEKHELQKALRIPVSKKGFSYPDKSKYNRKEKHKTKYV